MIGIFSDFTEESLVSREESCFFAAASSERSAVFSDCAAVTDFCSALTESVCALIFTSHNVEVSQIRIPQIMASDHCPITAEISF